jgi:hypothetical protein
MKQGDILGNIVGGTILVAFFLGILLVVFIPFEMKQLADARTWPSRTGIITQSSASPVYSKRRGTRWHYAIRGTFADNGQPFVITRVRYGQILFRDRGKTVSQEVVARYPVGRTVQVFYSPVNQRRMILEPEASADELQRALALGVVLAFLPVLLYAGGRLKKALTPADGEGQAQRRGIKNNHYHPG